VATEDSDGRTNTPVVTSFKRVVGMTSRQVKEIMSDDPEFWNSLPFECVVVEDDANDDKDDEDHGMDDGGNDGGVRRHDNGDGGVDDAFVDVLGDATVAYSTEDMSRRSRRADDDVTMKEGVAIRIRPGSDPSDDMVVTPLQVTTILLHAIRAAAFEYLTNNKRGSKIRPPGLRRDGDGVDDDDGSDRRMRNCVIGVPAHYGHAQRNAIRIAARDAGFDGNVSVMTESTAAALAYGLFVSPPPPTAPTNGNDDVGRGGDDGGIERKKNILVFDMGGGTTDVTIATMDFASKDAKKNDDDGVRFRVIATSGDRRLGGDDVDESLARCVWTKMHPSDESSNATEGGESTTTWKLSEHRELISECRRAKEELCGNTDDKCDSNSGKFAGISEASVALGGRTITITRQEFDCAIQPLIDRAERVVEEALSAMESRHGTASMIHEVVLVGASTHIPTVRSMLRRRFPPPIPPELCTSISAETAVAQGLAIQAALLSGLVPLWELRNAMMMDVLPHSIGVWVSPIDAKRGEDSGKVAPFAKGQIIHPNVDREEDEGYYVPILHKDAPLPAMGNAAFTLAAAGQHGVTVIAVEQIGPGDVFQCMGVFDFLLCRLKGKDGSNHDKVRQVKIGMTLQTSGEFTVSIYDENDPDHRKKRRRYLKEKASRDVSDGITLDDIELYHEEQKKDLGFSGTEISLAIFCIISFALYIAARVAFRDVDISDLNGEL
jgi:hypothetical protein